MKRCLQIALACSLLVAFGIAIWFALISRGEKEPIYEGKPLSYWLAAFDYSRLPGDEHPYPGLRDGRRAMHAAGTNAIPVLLRMLRPTDSSAKHKLNQLLSKQNLTRYRFKTASAGYDEALVAFRELRGRAAVAVPELIKMFNETPPLASKATIAQVLGGLGPAARDAIPSLQPEAFSTNIYLAATVKNALDGITSRNQSWFRLGDDYYLPAESSVKALFQYSSLGPPTTTLPELIDTLKQSSRNDYWAGFMLERIDPDAAAQVLTNVTETSTSAAPPTPDSSSSKLPRLMSAGTWSLSDHKLSAKLLVYEPALASESRKGLAGCAAIEVELAEVDHVLWQTPQTIFFDPAVSLQAELRDARGKPAPAGADVQGPLVPGFWITVPFDGEVRFRADSSRSAAPAQPDGLVLQLGRRSWRIPANDTNDYYLSATLTCSTSHVNPLQYRIWGGTLELPAVKIAGASLSK